MNTTSREEYRQLLESFDRDEYGLRPTVNVFEQVDHLQEIQRKNTDLRHRLHHTLSVNSRRSLPRFIDSSAFRIGADKSRRVVLSDIVKT